MRRVTATRMGVPAQENGCCRKTGETLRSGPMAVTTHDVRALTNSYRSAVESGDGKLADSPVERKLLIARVAASAQAVRSYLQTRVPDGDTIGEPLDALLPALQKEDVVGKSLAMVEQKARSSARAVASSTLTGAALPAWMLAVVQVVLGIIAFSFDAGEAVGAGLWSLLAGGTAALGFAVRTLVQAGPAMGKAIGDGHNSLMASIDSLGVRSEQLFASTVIPVLAATFGPNNGIRQPDPANDIRGYLKGIVVFTYVVVGIATIFFAVGVIDAFEAASKAPIISPL
jgi:hypothetical protein